MKNTLSFQVKIYEHCLYVFILEMIPITIMFFAGTFVKKRNSLQI